uniref:Uncharacterized protein n=1 Tax=Salmonella sp. TaxID=599 RepID=A0A482ETD2_SALSP|nr:hypothetical protein NNIBIDOC_00138 [Salmonella sp.]
MQDHGSARLPLIGIDEQTMEVQVNDTGDISGIKTEW